MPNKVWIKCCGVMLKALGWTACEPVVPEPKCIIIGVPHTSIWDFVISYLYYTSQGGTAKVMVKSSVFVWPIAGLMKKLGAVPIDRDHPAKQILSTIRQFEDNEVLHLAMCPEGTRKAIRKWKTGYHTIATQANVPVYLGYFDWGTKRIGRGRKFELTGDARADTERMQAIYETMHMTGKHPEGYVTH